MHQSALEAGEQLRQRPVVLRFAGVSVTVTSRELDQVGIAWRRTAVHSPPTTHR